MKNINICNSTADYKILWKMALIKKPNNIFKIEGNITYKIPFDDSLNVNISY